VVKYTKEQVFGFLEAEAVMSIAVSSSDGPLSSVVLYAIDDDFRFTFVTHKSSRKAQALLSDNRISVSIWNQQQMLVQMSGTVKEMTETDERMKGFDAVVNTSTTVKDLWPPLLTINAGEYIVFTITPEWIRALDLTEAKIAPHESPFTEIPL